jgi:hypothetical protein
VARKAVWLAAFVVLLSNAVALGFAWMNRAGAPDAELTLSERELRIQPRETENTAIALQVAWIDPAGAPGAVSWFDATKLASLGFDCSAPVTRENAPFYRGQAPRSAYAAFEFEGDSWNRYLASIPAGATRESAEAGSHLVLIDVGLDPAALRASHPDRHRVVIAPTTIGLSFRQPQGQPPVLTGHVNMVHPMEMSVPRRLRAALEGLPGQPRAPYDPQESWRGAPLTGSPRFHATLRWGRSFEPWLVSTDRTPTKLSGKNSVAQPRQ